MGQTGKVLLYSTKEPTSPPRLLDDILRLTGSSHAMFVYRSCGPDESWALFERNMKRLRSGRLIRSLEEMDFELVAEQSPIEDIARYFRPKECLFLWMLGPTIAEPVGLAAERDIPPEIRGQFWFRDLYVWFGWHDIFECAENEDGHLFARAFTSIQFHGHSTPSDWNEYRRRVFDLPEFKEAKARFETVTGPLEQCAFWDV